MKKKKGSKIFIKWNLIIPGVILILLGIGAAVLWTSNKENVLLAFLCVVGVPTGGLMVFQGLKAQTSTHVITAKGRRITTGVNAIAIITKEKDGIIKPSLIVPCNVKTPSGRMMRCRNTGEHLYILQNHTERPKLAPLELPDTQYLSPRTMRIPAVMQANEEYFTPAPTLFQKFRPAIMIIGLVVLGVIMIALSPPPAGG